MKVHWAAHADQDEPDAVGAWLLGSVAVTTFDPTNVAGLIQGLLGSELHRTIGHEVDGVEVVPMFPSDVVGREPRELHLEQIRAVLDSQIRCLQRFAEPPSGNWSTASGQRLSKPEHDPETVVDVIKQDLR